MAAPGTARGLSPADQKQIRESLAGGRRPKVVFTDAAGQIAGQTGQVVSLADPADSDEWITVRFGKDELPFEMTEKQAMIAGTELTGDVVVTARYDQDGDALSKQPGDIVGTLKVKIPAENVTLTLDEVLP